MSAEESVPLLSPGFLLKDHWQILKRIGRGGFGEIHKARDITTGKSCAIKVESSINPKQVLRMEVAVLKRLQNTTPHICEFFGCGRTDKVNYIIMSLLGPSLSELRKRQPHQRFSISTTLRIGIQIISAVRAIHDCGFLHRDIKPSNFAIGNTPETSRRCYMIDFGLARQYTTPTGEVRPPRHVAGFRGTVRYASVNAHLSKDLGRHDDIWSVFYMLVELATGQLPWRKFRGKEEAGEFKAGYDHKKLVRGLPAEFLDLLKHLQSLNYFQKPDYALMINLFLKAMKQLGVQESDPLDWEQDFSAPSVTTASAGSPPAIQVQEPPEDEKDNCNVVSGGSKTHCSDVEELGENGRGGGGEVEELGENGRGGVSENERRGDSEVEELRNNGKGDGEEVEELIENKGGDGGEVEELNENEGRDDGEAKELSENEGALCMDGGDEGNWQYREEQSQDKVVDVKHSTDGNNIKDQCDSKPALSEHEIVICNGICSTSSSFGKNKFEDKMTTPDEQPEHKMVVRHHVIQQGSIQSDSLDRFLEIRPQDDENKSAHSYIISEKDSTSMSKILRKVPSEKSHNAEPLVHPEYYHQPQKAYSSTSSHSTDPTSGSQQTPAKHPLVLPSDHSSQESLPDENNAPLHIDALSLAPKDSVNPQAPKLNVITPIELAQRSPSPPPTPMRKYPGLKPWNQILPTPLTIKLPLHSLKPLTNPFQPPPLTKPSHLPVLTKQSHLPPLTKPSKPPPPSIKPFTPSQLSPIELLAKPPQPPSIAKSSQTPSVELLTKSSQPSSHITQPRPPSPVEPLTKPSQPLSIQLFTKTSQPPPSVEPLMKTSQPPPSVEPLMKTSQPVEPVIKTSQPPPSVEPVVKTSQPVEPVIYKTSQPPPSVEPLTKTSQPPPSVEPVIKTPQPPPSVEPVIKTSQPPPSVEPLTKTSQPFPYVELLAEPSQALPLTISHLPTALKRLPLDLTFSHFENFAGENTIGPALIPKPPPLPPPSNYTCISARRRRFVRID